jgi:signal peptidase I
VTDPVPANDLPASKIEIVEPHLLPAAAPPPPPVDWVAEAKGIFWLILAVLGFHTLVAKPFYIPSESMMPGLMVGDRLVVSKFPYGYSYVSPTFHLLPFLAGRLFGRMPERGDVVIVTPNGLKEDYIKRVIGLPGDRLEIRNGTVFLNGVPVKRTAPVMRLIPIDANAPCKDIDYPGRRVRKNGEQFCELPIVRETLPNGVSFDTIDLDYKFDADDFAAITIPDGKLFLMGDNRDRSADSRFSVEMRGLGGPVPVENVGGRAEFITFSLDGSTIWWNPLTWAQALRSGRAGTNLHPDKGK